MSLLLSLFTGTSKWLYIALVALSIAFIGVSSLSISLYANKSALSAEIDLKDKFIIEQGRQLTKAISDNKELLIRVSAKSAEISFQNEVAKQNAIDRDKNLEREKQSSLLVKEKYRLLIEQINNVKVDENATCYETVDNFFRTIYP